MSCIVCGKPTRFGTDICSSTCALQKTPEPSRVDDKEPQNDKKSRTILSLIHSLEEVTTLNSVKLQEVSVIQVKHKWMKNRNLVSNRTVLSFDDCGVARIARLGSVLEDVEALMRRFPGQLTICQDEKKVEEKLIVDVVEKEEVKVEKLVVEEELAVEEVKPIVQEVKVEEFVEELKIEDVTEVMEKIPPPVIKKKQPFPFTKTKSK